MTDMASDENPRARLARLMDERRADLGLRWTDVIEIAGLTKEGLRGVRFGQGAIRQLTKRGIEKALEWESGTINAILASDEHEPIPQRPAPPEVPPGFIQETSTDPAIQAGLDAIRAIVAARDAEIAQKIDEQTRQLNAKIDEQSKQIRDLRDELQRKRDSKADGQQDIA